MSDVRDVPLTAIDGRSLPMKIFKDQPVLLVQVFGPRTDALDPEFRAAVDEAR